VLFLCRTRHRGSFRFVRRLRRYYGEARLLVSVHHRLRSGRIGARTGLRMMPTFPRSPLSFRTASFPQYGWKAGLSDGPSQHGVQLKPAPGMRWPSPGLRPSFARLVTPPLAPHCVGPCGLDCAPPLSVSTYPRGPRSGSGCRVPIHHHLIGPIRPAHRHIATSPHGGLYAMPSLCGSA
jgi:hypothetical protein